jgi:hypothetical protein
MDERAGRLESETGQLVDERDFRATSDRMLDTLAKLREVEEAKRHLPIGAPEFLRLAAESLALAGRVWSWSNLQDRLARAAPEAVSRGEVAETAIDAVESRASHLILADWREALTRLRAAAPGTDEAAIASADADRLRLEFQEMSARRRATHETGRAGRDL